MKTLDKVLHELQKLRKVPEPDLWVYEDSAAFLRKANDEAIMSGIDPEPVRELVNPVNAIAAVKRIQKAQSPDLFMTVPEAAEALRVRHQTVTRWIKDGRLEFVDVGKKGSPAYRVPRYALLQLVPEKTKVRKCKFL